MLNANGRSLEQRVEDRVVGRLQEHHQHDCHNGASQQPKPAWRGDRTGEHGRPNRRWPVQSPDERPQQHHYRARNSSKRHLVLNLRRQVPKQILLHRGRNRRTPVSPGHQAVTDFMDKEGRTDRRGENQPPSPGDIPWSDRNGHGSRSLRYPRARGRLPLIVAQRVGHSLSRGRENCALPAVRLRTCRMARVAQPGGAATGSGGRWSLPPERSAAGRSRRCRRTQRPEGPNSGLEHSCRLERQGLVCPCVDRLMPPEFP